MQCGAGRADHFSWYLMVHIPNKFAFNQIIPVLWSLGSRLHQLPCCYFSLAADSGGGSSQILDLLCTRLCVCVCFILHIILLDYYYRWCIIAWAPAELVASDPAGPKVLQGSSSYHTRCMFVKWWLNYFSNWNTLRDCTEIIWQEEVKGCLVFFMLNLDAIFKHKGQFCLCSISYSTWINRPPWV